MYMPCYPLAQIHDLVSAHSKCGMLHNTMTDSSHAAGFVLQLGSMLRVGLPAFNGVVEPALFLVHLWGSATALVLTMLRIASD